MLEPLSAPILEAIHGPLGYWSCQAEERFTKSVTDISRRGLPRGIAVGPVGAVARDHIDPLRAHCGPCGRTGRSRFGSRSGFVGSPAVWRLRVLGRWRAERRAVLGRPRGGADGRGRHRRFVIEDPDLRLWGGWVWAGWSSVGLGSGLDRVAGRHRSDTARFDPGRRHAAATGVTAASGMGFEPDAPTNPCTTSTNSAPRGGGDQRPRPCALRQPRRACRSKIVRVRRTDACVLTHGEKALARTSCVRGSLMSRKRRKRPCGS